jgi:ubiquinone/menaquinone biosynthesis C-methylase UbiE
MVERKATPEISDSLYATRNDARIYDVIYGLTEKEDIPFWLNLTEQIRPKNILEIGVGTGRIAISLAKAGFNVMGLDREESMLDVAREKIAKFSQDDRDRLKFVRGDARYVDLGQTFDLITIPLNTFCHFLTKEDQVTVLKNLKKHLDPQEGVLAIDMFNPLSRPVQRWDSSKQGQISIDRPPIKTYIAIDSKKKMIVTRKVRDYIDPAKNDLSAGDMLLVDREAEVIDFNLTPPAIFRNRSAFPVSYHSVFSLCFGQVFREAGFESLRFIGDYKGHKFVDAKIESGLHTIEVKFHPPVSEKMIIVAGPGQNKVRIKDYSIEKAKTVKESVLEVTFDDANIKAFDFQEASDVLNFLSQFSKLSDKGRKKALERMDRILAGAKTSKIQAKQA